MKVRALARQRVAAAFVLASGLAGLAAQSVQAGQSGQATVAVLVGLPEELGRVAAQVLAEQLGDAIHVELRSDPKADEEIGRAVLVGFDEWRLWQLARRARLQTLTGVLTMLPAEPAGRWVLGWRQRYALVYAREVFAETPPQSLEELALAHEITGQLGLLAPSGDAAPWLAGMEEALQRGLGEDAGYALWTTLDARASAYAASYQAIREGLVAGRYLAAVVPRAMAHAWRLEHAHLSVGELREGTPVQRLGVAVAGANPTAGSSTGSSTGSSIGPIDEPMLGVVRAVLAPELLAAVAARVGLEQIPSGADAVAELHGEVVRGWLEHFDEQIRGKGGEVEGVADMLDLVFTLGFVLIVLGVSWYYRKHGDRADERDGGAR